MLYLIKWLIKKVIKNDGQGVDANESERRQLRKFGGENLCEL